MEELPNSLFTPDKSDNHPAGSRFPRAENSRELRERLRRERRLTSLGTAAAMLAHEFNNVMTPVVGYAKFALDCKDPELMVKALQITVRQSDTALAMAERILGMAVDEPATAQAVPLRQVVDEAIAALCRDLSKDGITLRVDIAEDINVWGDARQFQQVFFNLLLNAREAINGNPGRITFQAADNSDHTVTVSVSDNGCGIEPEQLPSVFDRFFTTKVPGNGTHRRGTGLGLSICRDIVEECGGRIAVRSTVGRGTTFDVTLPRAH